MSHSAQFCTCGARDLQRGKRSLDHAIPPTVGWLLVELAPWCQSLQDSVWRAEAEEVPQGLASDPVAWCAVILLILLFLFLLTMSLTSRCGRAPQGDIRCQWGSLWLLSAVNSCIIHGFPFANQLKIAAVVKMQFVEELPTWHYQAKVNQSHDQCRHPGLRFIQRGLLMSPYSHSLNGAYAHIYIYICCRVDILAMKS